MIAPFRLARLFVFLALVFPTPSSACFMRSPSPLPATVKLDRIMVDITDQVAVKKYDCTFYNPNSSAMVGGECFMEVEPGAQVDNMTLVVGDTKLDAEILDVQKAQQLFTEMVRQGGSPALLEYYGSQLIRSQVPKIPHFGTLKVRLQYTTILKRENGLVRIKVLNTNPKTLMQPLDHASVQIRIKSTEPVTNVYSPTHEIKIDEAEEDLVIKWSEDNYLPKTPFVVYYGVSTSEVGANLLPYREEDEEGTFMLLLSPSLAAGETPERRLEPLSKDIVFCVDTSGSMVENGKIVQLQNALNHCVDNLSPGDRFNIVNFSTEARRFSRSGLLEFNEENRKKGLRYVEKLNARGGTAIQEALEMALAQFDESSRPRMIVFITDGQPTIGETDPEKLISQFNKGNENKIRLFTFGLGYDVNAKLLDALALDSTGRSDYILPKENIMEGISTAFDRLKAPMLTDLSVEILGVDTDEIYPRKIPDLLKGDQVTLFGRFTGAGDATVKLSGRHGKPSRTWEFPVSFPEAQEQADFVPRLWAGQKVRYLLAEMKRNGENSELVEEVVRLAKRHGIITPYTSFLVTEDVAAKDPNVAALAPEKRFRNQILGKLREQSALFAGGRSAGAPAPEMAGAVEDSARMSRQSARTRAYDVAEAEMKEAGREGPVLGVLRYIGNHTFYKGSDSIWYDSRWQASKGEATPIKVGSAEYFDLLRRHPAAAPYLALVQVVFKVGGTFYKVVS